MSELTNPLFDEEKEFLERKKLEYERALRGDMETIKEKSATVGRVALVGAGLTGSVWLITKLFSSSGDKKKSKKKAKRLAAEYDQYSDEYDADYADEDHDQGYEGEDDADYYSAGNGKRYKTKRDHKSAFQSAQVFMDDRADADAADAEARQEASSKSRPSGNILSDSEAHSAPASRQRQPQTQQPTSQPEAKKPEAQQPEAKKPRFDEQPQSSAASRQSSLAQSFGAEDDPFQDLPYDDSRRLPDTHDDFAAEEDANAEREGRPSYFGGGTRMLGTVLQAFLKSDTGKMLVAQTGAVVLAMVTKKVSELLPDDKNDDLAVSPGYEPVKEGFSPTTSEPAHPSDEFIDTPPQPQNL